MGTLWVIIPAAGSGQRFQQVVPKQYTLIHNKTILEYSAEIFLKLPQINKVVIGISPHDQFIADLNLQHHPKIQLVLGGATRAETVLNALHYLGSQVGSDDWILVHDAVRPCLHLNDLTNLIAQLQLDEVGGILASPVVDTLKKLQNNQVQTLDRTHLWRALTPQMFRFQKLKTALSHCLAQNIAITDEASALENYGCSIKLVQAQYANPKLTYQDDLQFIKHLLQQSTDEVVTL